jgi:hypothetical protein
LGLPSSPEIVCIVSHDSGGAEILSSYVAKHGLQPLYCLDGPASSIFQRKLGDIENLDLDQAMDRCTWVLCGTSWQSDLEVRAIVIAAHLGKRSVAFLDHWVNYSERFERGGQRNLPDEVWVGDEIAQGIAAARLADVNIRLVENPYTEDVQRQLAEIEKRAGPRTTSGTRVLYVAEPIAEHARLQHGDERYWGYTEHDALRYFLVNLAALGAAVGEVVIRPHPSEKIEKYDWAREEFGGIVTFGGERTLFEEIADADIIVGCASMAMVVGLIAGRRVISSMLPGGKVAKLPQPKIEYLEQLIERQ